MSGRTRTKTDTRSGHFNDGDFKGDDDDDYYEQNCDRDRKVYDENDCKDYASVILWFIDWKLHLQNGTLQIVMIIYFVTTKIRDIMMFFGKLCYDFLCSKHCGNGNRMRGK